MTTIKQVAQHAGVSRATVSRVLNKQPQVDPDLRDRVLASVAELHYQPSAVARSLRSRQSNTIGLIVPDNRNPFFAEIASGIEQFCYGENYSVYLCNSADDDVKEIEYCHNLYQQRVAGVIMAITGRSADGIRYLHNQEMPVVLLDRRHSDVEADSVQCDHYLGAKDAVEYLIALGHRHIGLIIGPVHHPPVRDRLRACQDALRTHGSTLEASMIWEVPDYEYESGYTGARELLNRENRPTAIFAFKDTIAAGALRYALEHGIAVPGELSIIGVDNQPLASYISPRLTTVAQPMVELGRTAAQLLLDRVQGLSGPPEQRVLPT